MALKTYLKKLSFIRYFINKEFNNVYSHKKFKNVEFKGNNEIVNSNIGEYSYISKNSIIHNAQIGKFCSIGPNVVIGYGDHPTNYLSTSPRVYYREIFPEFKTSTSFENYVSNNPVTIGSDVWIGANCFIKNGVTIGDGAIIGAGAVVNKDLTPYSINVGVPVKKIRNRFTQDIIDELLKLKWWNYPVSSIKQIEPFLSREIDINIINNIRIILKKE